MGYYSHGIEFKKFVLKIYTDIISAIKIKNFYMTFLENTKIILITKKWKKSAAFLTHYLKKIDYVERLKYRIIFSSKS